MVAENAQKAGTPAETIIEASDRPVTGFAASIRGAICLSVATLCLSAVALGLAG